MPKPNSNLTFNRTVYAARQRFLSNYAKAHNISYTAAQRNQNYILNTSDDWARGLSNIREHYQRGGFETAQGRLNQHRGIGEPLASSTQRPGPSNETTEDPFDNMEYFQQLKTQNENMDTTDSIEKRSAGGGGETIGGSPSVMGQASELQILHNPTTRGTTWSIKHSHLFQTWGYQFKMYEETTANAKSYLLHYPLALVPVDFVPFYMTPQEFENLPRGTFIEDVIVKITPKGIRCSFDTATTLSGHVNNQQTVFGISAIGLNHKYLLRHRKVKANSTSPMCPEYSTISKTDMDRVVTRLWGTKTSDSNFTKEFPTGLWTVRSLPYYAGIFLPTDKENSSFTLDTGHVDLTSHTNVFNVLDHKDVPCLNYSYKPKFAPLKVKKHISGTDHNVGKGHQYHGNVYSMYNINTSIEGGLMETKQPLNGTSVNWDLSWEKENNYEAPVEQAHYKTTPQVPFHTMSQPQVHIGLLPVQSNAPSDVDASFVNASALYYIETEIRLNKY